MSDEDIKDFVPTIEDVVSHPSYDQAASRVAKSYIFMYFIFCGVVAYLDAPSLGLWWLAVIGVGLFASSIVFALPVTYIKLTLGTKAGISPLTVKGKFLYLAIDLIGYVALWYATRITINFLSS